MALGVFGRLRRRDDTPEQDEDCYSVFHALSSLLGFIVPMRSGGIAHWGMNDAGGPWFTETESALCGWFQVSPLEERVLGLPVAFLTAASVETLGRFGELELSGFEYYLPSRVAGPAARQISNAENWFALAPPMARTRIHLTLDSGDSGMIVHSHDELLRALAGVAPSGEGLDPRLVGGAEIIEFADSVPWRWWLGEVAPHAVTFSATATEWTPLGVGRVVSLVSEACRSIGMTDHIGVRVVRAED